MNLVLRASLVWLAIACLAVGNGLAREVIFTPWLGAGIALPLSGLTLSIIVYLVTYLCLDFFQARQRHTFLLVGLQWVLMTLAFELLFGHFVSHKPWEVLLQTFNIATGDLFSVVLLVTFLSPWAAAKIKGMI